MPGVWRHGVENHPASYRPMELARQRATNHGPCHPILQEGKIHTCFAEVRQMLVRRVRNDECVWRRKLKAAVLDRIAVTIDSAPAHGTLKSTTSLRSQIAYRLASDGCLFSLKRFPGRLEVFSRYWLTARGREQSIFGSRPAEHI